MKSQQTALLLLACAWGVLGVDHAELRGEHPNQEDIDNGQCVPIPCEFGIPPKECTRLCALRHYIPICHSPAQFCLCQHLVNGKVVLVSPDEVADEPPEPELPDKDTDTETDSTPQSFTFFAIFLPIKQFFSDDSTASELQLSIPEPTADTMDNVEYQSVNVHEGRLFWDFRYILTGLLLLMIGLVVYELIMCAIQVYGPKRELSVKCDPVKKVNPPFVEKEKILNSV